MANSDNLKKITFNDLSFWLKVAIVCGWVYGVISAIEFLIGFFIGLLSSA